MTGAPHSSRTFRVQGEFTAISLAAKNRPAFVRASGSLPGERDRHGTADAAPQASTPWVSPTRRRLVRHDRGRRHVTADGRRLTTVRSVLMSNMAARPGPAR